MLGLLTETGLHPLLMFYVKIFLFRLLETSHLSETGFVTSFWTEYCSRWSESQIHDVLSIYRTVIFNYNMLHLSSVLFFIPTCY